MKTKIQPQNKHSIGQLERAIQSSYDEAQKTRLRAIIALKKGRSKTVVAKDLVVDRTSVIAWVKVYNDKGIPGLSMSKGGRSEGNPVWDRDIFTALTKELDKQEKCWSLPLMREWIKKHKKRDIPEQTIWYHLYHLHMSIDTPSSISQNHPIILVDITISRRTYKKHSSVSVFPCCGGRI